MNEPASEQVVPIHVLREYTPARLRGLYRTRAKMYQPDTHAQWIKEHLKTRDWDVWAADYFFVHERDAIMFALVWG